MKKTTKPVLKQRQPDLLRSRPLESDPVPDPLEGIDYSNPDLEEVALREADMVMSGFQQRAKKDEERYDLATDTEFWFAVCFESHRQKDEFLHLTGWVDLGDKYIDGVWLAELLGIETPVEPLVRNLKNKRDPKLYALTEKGALKSKKVKK